jgi:hypothetical protein
VEVAVGAVVWVAVGVGVGLGVSVGVGVAVGVGVRVCVAVGDDVAVGLGVCVAVRVAVSVLVAACVAVGVILAVQVGGRVGEADGGPAQAGTNRQTARLRIQCLITAYLHNVAGRPNHLRRHYSTRRRHGQDAYKKGDQRSQLRSS